MGQSFTKSFGSEKKLLCRLGWWSLHCHQQPTFCFRIISHYRDAALMRNYSPTWDCWAFQGNNFLAYNRKNICKHISVVAIISAKSCRNTIIESDKILSQAARPHGASPINELNLIIHFWEHMIISLN